MSVIRHTFTQIQLLIYIGFLKDGEKMPKKQLIITDVFISESQEEMEEAIRKNIIRLIIHQQKLEAKET